MSAKRFNYVPSKLKQHNEKRDKEISLKNYRKSDQYKQLLRDKPDVSIRYNDESG
ncbi:hypothetical protein [Paenibacillus amylolyticus]|uniref:hypothetical protein n=1 Tax=Paenibacillus amylolyticus TaxID=1451 RepID=UPI00339B9D1B